MNGLPQVTRQTQRADGIEVEFLLDADNPWFDGHFPGRPILPGVVQIGWAAHFAGILRGDDTPPTRLERVKFKYPVGPGAHMVLRLARVGQDIRYGYELLGGAEPVAVSSGMLCYAEAL